MYLHQLYGGQNMINLSQYITCKRVKFIYKLIHSNYEHWNMIGKNWIQKLDIKYNTDNFLCKCSSIKNLNLDFLPKYYFDSVAAWINLQSKKLIVDRESILSEYICGNAHILFKHRPLWFNSYSKSGIRTIKDIWDIENKTFYCGNEVYNLLLDRTNWIAEFNKIKKCIPKDWIKILESNENPTQCNKPFKIKDSIYLHDHNNTFIQPQKILVKKIQQYFIDYKYQPKCQIKWESTFNEKFNWKNIWKSSMELPCSNKEKQFHWKIIHNALFTEHRLQVMGMSNGKCHFCKNETENVCHLFYSCTIIRNIIQDVESNINTIIREKYQEIITLQLKNVILGFIHVNTNIETFVNFILHMLKWEIWKQRNLIKFENRNMSRTSLLAQFRNKINASGQFLNKTVIAQKNKRLIDFLYSF